MPAGDGHVVQEDVALRVAAGRGQLAVQQEAAARVRAAAHHQQRRAGRQRVDGGLRLRGQRRHCVCPVASASYASRPEMEIVEVVSEARSGRRTGPQRRAAVGAEPAGLRVAVTAPRTNQADMDGSSCRGCPAWALVAYGSAANPPPVLEVDGSPKPMRPAPAGSTDDAP